MSVVLKKGGSEACFPINGIAPHKKSGRTLSLSVCPSVSLYVCPTLSFCLSVCLSLSFWYACLHAYSSICESLLFSLTVRFSHCLSRPVSLPSCQSSLSLSFGLFIFSFMFLCLSIPQSQSFWPWLQSLLKHHLSSKFFLQSRTSHSGNFKSFSKLF